eukprot:373831-Rhodomonas_salina.3
MHVSFLCAESGYPGTHEDVGAYAVRLGTGKSCLHLAVRVGQLRFAESQTVLPTKYAGIAAQPQVP